YKPRWEWISIRPGVSTPPSPSSTSAHAGGTPSPIAAILPSSSSTHPQKRVSCASIVQTSTFLISVCFMQNLEKTIDIFGNIWYINHGSWENCHAPFISLSPQSYFWRSFFRRGAFFCLLGKFPLH